MPNPNEQGVQRYYRRKESRWGYRFLLKGTKHYGYYPEGRRNGLSMAEAQRLMERELGKALELPRGAKVLDAGCGEGYVAMHLAQEFGYDVHGIDLLPEAIKSAEDNKAKANLGTINFSVMDYSETSFPEDTFDGIYTIETFVHTPDYKKTLQEFYRILKPGGVLVNFEYALADRMTAQQEYDWEVMFKGAAMMGVFKDWRISKMQGIWELAGFTNVSVRNATKEMEPFMKRLHDLALIPYHILKLFGKEEGYVNTFAGVRSYELRHLYQYSMIKSRKPL